MKSTGVIVKKHIIHNDANKCYLVMQQIGPDYLISVKLRDRDEIYASGDNDRLIYEVRPIFNWYLKLGLLETMEILVGEDLQLRIKINEYSR